MSLSKKLDAISVGFEPTSKSKLRSKLEEVIEAMDASIYRSIFMARFELKVDEEKAGKILKILRA